MSEEVQGETAAKEDWFQKGYKGIQQEEERIAASIQPNRIWLKTGTKRDLIFVDDDPVTLHEHNYYDDGKWTNWLTCAQARHDDTVCCQKLGAKSRQWVGYLTVIDCSEWTDKQGNKRRYEMQLLRAPKDVLKILESRKEDQGTLVGALMSVQRIGEKSASCGNDFAFKKLVELPKVFELACYKGKKIKDLIATANADEKEMKLFRSRFACELVDGKIPNQLFSFNYMELLRPKTPKVMKAILSGYKSVKGMDSAREPDAPGSGNQDDDIPF